MSPSDVPAESDWTCACGAENKAYRTRCIQCGREPSAQPEEEPAVDLRKLGIDARAKITWGESPDRVLAWLIDEGMSRPQATRLIDEAVGERKRSFRRKGMIDLIGGLAGVLLLGSALYLLEGSSRTPTARGGGALIFGFFVALYFTARGTWRLVTGGAGEGADSNLE